MAKLQFAVLIPQRNRVQSSGDGRRVRIHYKDPFFYCFLSHVTERYSCYACPAKELKSGSDITLGDFGDFAAPRTFG